MYDVYILTLTNQIHEKNINGLTAHVLTLFLAH